MKKITITLALLLAFSIPAQAEKDTRSPIDAYEGTVAASVLLCPMKLELASMRGNSDQPGETDWPACIAESKKDVKVRYNAALKTIKKPAARSALKEHYITALATITSIAPEPDETRMNYQRRQADNNGKLTERWSRFEVEH